MKNIFRIEINPDRIFGLDILRALAIVFVVAGHASYLLPRSISEVSNLLLFDGVSIFFVLSGFLIGGILIKSIEKKGLNRKTLMNFWIRRWFRTLPNYFLILLILCFLHLFFTDDFTFRSVYRYFFFGQNLFREHPSWFFPEAWTISVEEWFYILTPILIALFTLLLKMESKRIILLTAVSVIFLIILFRFYRYSTISINSINEWDLIFRKQIFTRLDSLMIGVLGAYVNIYQTKLWLKYKTILFIFGIVLFIFKKFVIDRYSSIHSLYLTVFSFSVYSIATLSLLPYLSNLKKGKGFFFKSLTYISLISYSMYLLNLSVVNRFIINTMPWTDIIKNTYAIVVIKYLLYWVLLILLSIILYKYFEVPTTKIRDQEKFRRD